jgi:hypothetical protein
MAGLSENGNKISGPIPAVVYRFFKEHCISCKVIISDIGLFYSNKHNPEVLSGKSL